LLCRVRYQITGTSQIDFKAESAKFADVIKMYDSNSDSLFV